MRRSQIFSSDISEAFPNGEYSHYFRADWLTSMARETRSNRDYSQRTQDTARWAREQIKRQAGKTSPHIRRESSVLEFIRVFRRAS